MSDLDYSVIGHYNPIKAITNGWPIRISKSSFMTYLDCPRKYWWQNIEMEDMRTPATYYMVHGTDTHLTLENCYGNWMAGDRGELRDMFNTNPEDRYYTPYDHDAVDSMAELEQQRRDDWGDEDFGPIEFEVKHEQLIDFEWVDEDGNNQSYPIVLVGKIDGLFKHPETGKLMIGELKTGKLGKMKMGKTRKELCFYAFMLELLGYGDTSHFFYIYPECENEEIVLELLEKEAKGKIQVWVGDCIGVSYVEPTMKRSVTAFQKSLSKVVGGLRSMNWDMNFRDWWCNNYCDFHLPCESEIVGEMENITERKE